jgi:hypothetical protein
MPQRKTEKSPQALVIYSPMRVAEGRSGIRPKRLAAVVTSQKPVAWVEEGFTRHHVDPLSHDSAPDTLLVLKANLKLPAQIICT